jgi:cytochrome c oxidase subunit 2
MSQALRAHHASEALYRALMEMEDIFLMRWISTLVMLFTLVETGAVHGKSRQESPRVIEVHVKRFAFSPNEIAIKKGESVDLRLISEDVSHSLVKLETSKGHPADMTLTPQTVGDFHGQCGTFCGNGHGTMTFTVHVQENDVSPTPPSR